MRKYLSISALVVLLATTAFADYTIILRNGTTYLAKEKWKIVNGQAVVTLESGTQITFDPKLIDIERTDQANKMGLGDARLINVQQGTAPPPPQQSLGSVTTLRRGETKPAETRRDAPATPAPVTSATSISKETIGKFQRAYDNVGLFDANIQPIGESKLKIALTANNEDEVFKAISATAFLLANLGDVSEAQLLMSTFNGGSAGKFEMSRGDAKALTDKHISWHSYFVQKVIF